MNGYEWYNKDSEMKKKQNFLVNVFLCNSFSFHNHIKSTVPWFLHTDILVSIYTKNSTYISQFVC